MVINLWQNPDHSPVNHKTFKENLVADIKFKIRVVLEPMHYIYDIANNKEARRINQLSILIWANSRSEFRTVPNMITAGLRKIHAHYK